jgi:hypothetical protein
MPDGRLDGGVFEIYNELLRFNHTRFTYLKACLNESLRENVQIVEFKRDLFYFDKKGVEQDALLEFKRQYARAYPKFIDFVLIIYQIRLNT